jgi:hypothetical protein
MDYKCMIKLVAIIDYVTEHIQKCLYDLNKKPGITGLN